MLVQYHASWQSFTQLMNKKTRTQMFCAKQKEPSNSQFKVDPDKARQALDKLDQQLFHKQLSTPPNIPGKDLDKPQRWVREEAPDFSGSFLGYSAFTLLLFSIIYNVVFITYIKPSIDFPEQVDATYVGKSVDFTKFK